MSCDLLILGASVRAAAQSARRSGYAPMGADLFADVDLLACGSAVQVQKYPLGLQRIAESWPSLPWMYTGAIENYPRVIERVSVGRTLWGNGAVTVQRVRDPWQLQQVLRDAGLPFPETRRAVDGARDGQWLRKARRSAGGMQVETWDAERSSAELPSGSYFQRRLDGQHVAGVFVANGKASRLLGVSSQRLRDVGSGDFRYAGSSTAVPNHDEIAEQLERIGAVVAAEFELLGLFGVDAVFDSEQVWPVEVNPRYTASVEIHERSGNFQTVEMHAAACGEGLLPDAGYAAPKMPMPKMHVGKTIHYAQHDITIGPRFADWTEKLNAEGRWPVIADIPHAGSEITTGQPLTTTLVAGESPAELERREAELLGELRSVVYSA